jgi:hypothetical protein
MDPLQTHLDLREDSEISHSEEVSIVLEAAGGGASFGGEEAIRATSRRGEEARIGSRGEEKER